MAQHFLYTLRLMLRNKVDFTILWQENHSWESLLCNRTIWENGAKHFINAPFTTRVGYNRAPNQLWVRLHSPYIARIPQVAVLSVGHEDKRTLISRGPICAAIRRDLLPSKTRIHPRTFRIFWVQASAFIQLCTQFPRQSTNHKCYELQNMLPVMKVTRIARIENQLLK